jgi:hypothetical protein
MEISSTRGGILAESTHETKTTITHVFEHIIFTSDNVNLLDITLTGKMRRFTRYYLEISAA